MTGAHSASPTAPPAAADDRGRAVHGTSLAFVRVDRCGSVRDWNPAAEQLFGWTRDEVLGLALADTIVPARLRASHLAAFARRLVAGTDEPHRARMDVPAAHRDGSELRVTMVVDTLPDGFCAFVSDRTDEHHAHQELQRSTALVTAMLEHTSAMVSAKDLTGSFLFVNGEYERMFGVTAADLVGRPDTALLPPAVAAAGRVHDVRVAGSGQACTVLEELPSGDEIRQYVVTRFPLTEPDGTVYGVCAIAIDDTDRRRAEAALNASEQRFRDTVNNAPGMLFQYLVGVDGAASFAFVSDGCREIFGCEPAEALADAACITGMVADEDRAAFEASVVEAVTTCEPWRWQGSIVRPDGERRWVHGVSRPHRLPDGTVQCDGVLLDRTDERRTELALEAGRQEVDELIRRLAVHRFEAVADEAGRVRPAAGDGDLVAAIPAQVWTTVLRGEPVDLECSVAGRPLWIRLRLREAAGRRVVDGSCFDLAKP